VKRRLAASGAWLGLLSLGALGGFGTGCSVSAFPVVPGGPTHAWFPLAPGRYRDYRVTLLGVGVRYLRVTVGASEVRLGRSVYPCVYGPVPGLAPDTLRVGLRQYYSVAADGALWFHGAENGAAASHTDPPVRQLLADPQPNQAWTDTVRFESFFPLGTPFLVDHEVFTSTTTDLASLTVPAGTFDVLRSSATEVSLDNPLAAAATVPADSIPPERGTWFARRHGPVAVDWPTGPTSGFANSVTFELMGEGVGLLPPRRKVWETALLPQAAVRMGPESVSAAGSSDRPVMRSGLRTRSSP
jgi:hypothetical protein